MRRQPIIYCSICLIIGILLGILANRNREHLINGQFVRNHLHFRNKVDSLHSVVTSDSLMVCLTFGQSNAANYGEGSFSSINNIFNYYNGELYLAKEPLLGTDGNGISVWTRVASQLLKERLFKKIIIVPIAVGGTSIDQWISGDCRVKLEKTLLELARDSIKITHIFWSQGETDNVDGTSEVVYETSLTKLVNIFREIGIDAPFFVSKTSYFPYNNDNRLGIDEDIILAQNNVVEKIENVFSGPNTDSINLAYYRKDAVHFTEKGLDTLASQWVRKIILSKKY